MSTLYMTQTFETLINTNHYVRAASLADVQAAGSLLVNLEQHAIALFYSGNRVYAIDNRCPHMGFPLHGSTCKDGIVTCPWHYARFDLGSGGTFDSWALRTLTAWKSQLPGAIQWIW